MGVVVRVVGVDAVFGFEEDLEVGGEGGGEFLPGEEFQVRGEGGRVDGGEDCVPGFDEVVAGRSRRGRRSRLGGVGGEVGCG